MKKSDKKYTWITTHTGRRFDLANPDPRQVSIQDIAHHLAHISRFGGALDCFYSVAQHSVWVSHQVPASTALEALFHDAAEAYMGDMVSPLKAMLPQFKSIEKTVHASICKQLQLRNLYENMVLYDHIKRADKKALVFERMRFQTGYRSRGHNPDESVTMWPDDNPQWRIPWQPNEARDKFLRRYIALLDEPWTRKNKL